MSGKILSQDEIDLLLSSSDTEEQYDLDFDMLGEIGNISMGSAATTLSTLLNKRVSITVPQVDNASAQQLRDMYPRPFVRIEVEYTEGLLGKSLLIIRETDARIIANLMMGGDGSSLSAELDEIALSAVGEAMNQMMGTAATSMATIFGHPVQISPPYSELFDSEEEMFDQFDALDGLVRISFRMQVENLIDSNIMLLMSPKFADDMISKVKAGMQQVEEAQSTAGGIVHSTAPNESSSQRSQKTGYDAAANKYKHQQQLRSEFSQQKEEPPVVVRPAQFAPLKESEVTAASNIDLILDVPLQLTVELGRTTRNVGNILEMGPGTIIELDRLAGEPVDIYINQKLIAKGEVVVIEENFAVRITDIVSVMERVTKLK